MHYYEVAPNQIIRAASATFTYSSATALNVGSLVTIEVGKKNLVGLIIKKVQKPTYATKEITSILDLPPLPQQLLDLALWMSSYYNTHLATTLQTLLPRGIQKTRRARSRTPHLSSRDRTHFLLTEDQKRALQQINESKEGTVVLHGITGSGKTQVYIELAKELIKQNRSVIILVPEIALTSQLVDDFSHQFNDILLTHSKQTEAERHMAWQDALTSDTPRIVIGPRSALFTPLKNIGVVIIDEAHEPSFKQEQSPRYSALRAASILMQKHHGKLILGSATPTISDYYLARHTKSPIIEMKKPARSGASKPTIDVVDMTKRDNFKQHRFFSNKMLARIEQTLANKEQVLLFHNRRGSASTTLCESCGWSALCDRCFTPLTLHIDKHHLRCHICDATQKIPTHCPACGAVDVIHKGIGTKLIESELQKRFPNATIARFDGDNETSAGVDARYKDLYDGTIDILIGTQVVAKGLDLPHLRMVGIIQADAGLSMPDFSTNERVFQLLAQVVGRVGRSHHATRIVIQTFTPQHPSIIDGIAQNYDHFYNTALLERQKAHFPPFTYLLKLTCTYKSEAAAIRNAQALARELKKSSHSIEILGPTPAFYERVRDTYRWQIIVKSPVRHHLQSALSVVPSTHWQYELDPTSLL